MPDTEPVLLTVSQTAVRLSLSKTRVYELVNGGELERKYIGDRSYRIPVESIDAYVASLPTEPALP